MCVFSGGCGGDVCVNFSFMCLHAFTHKYDASYKKNPQQLYIFNGFSLRNKDRKVCTSLISCYYDAKAPL